MTCAKAHHKLSPHIKWSVASLAMVINTKSKMLLMLLVLSFIFQSFIKYGAWVSILKVAEMLHNFTKLKNRPPKTALKLLSRSFDWLQLLSPNTICDIVWVKDGVSTQTSLCYLIQTVWIYVLSVPFGVCVCFSWCGGEGGNVRILIIRRLVTWSIG